MKTICTLAALSIAFLPMQPAHAAGRPEAGETLALQWCSNCHAAAGAAVAKDGAPSFQVIAKRHAAERGWLRAWLAAPHAPMPDPGLSRQQIDDIDAYLDELSQR